MVPGIALRPWQSSFVKWASDDVRGRILILDVPVGSGKGLALVALVDEVMRRNDNAHVVLSSPSRLVLEQYQHIFEGLGVTVPYRVALQKSSALWEGDQSAADLFPCGLTLATYALLRRTLSDQFAKQYCLDLVIIDGGITPTSVVGKAVADGVRSGMISRLLITGSGPDIGIEFAATGLSTEAITIRDVQQPAHPSLEFVNFYRTDQELQLAEAISGLGTSGSWQRHLSSAAASGLAASERALLDLRNELAHGGEMDLYALRGESDDTSINELSDPTGDAPGLWERIIIALRLLNNIPRDSKFEALRNYLHVAQPRHIAIAISHLATGDYIRSMLNRERDVESLAVLREPADLVRFDPRALLVIYDDDTPLMQSLGSLRIPSGAVQMRERFGSASPLPT